MSEGGEESDPSRIVQSRLAHIGEIKPHYFRNEELQEKFGIEAIEYGGFRCLRCHHEWHGGRLIDDGEEFVPPSGLDCTACARKREERIADMNRYLEYKLPQPQVEEGLDFLASKLEQDRADLLERMTECLDLTEDATIEELYFLGTSVMHDQTICKTRLCDTLNYPESTLTRLQNKSILPMGDWFHGLSIDSGLKIVRYVLERQAEKKAMEDRKLQKKGATI